MGGIDLFSGSLDERFGFADDGEEDFREGRLLGNLVTLTCCCCFGGLDFC